MGECVAIRIGKPISRAAVEAAVAPALFVPADRHDERWLQVFAALLDYVAREGHACPRRQHVEGAEPLGEWAHYQRTQQGRGRLRPARAELLSLVPGWVWAPNDETWMRHLALLSQAVEDGGARLHRQDAFGGTALGQWSELQRQRYRNGTMPPSQEALLAVIPGWSWATRQDAAWERWFTELQRVAPAAPRGPLRQWANRQRLDRAAGRLPPHREQKLASLPGWSWRLLDEQWESNYLRLCAFAESNGHTYPSRRDRVGGKELWQWIRRQRVKRANGELAADRCAALEDVPGWRWAMAPPAGEEVTFNGPDGNAGAS